MGAKQRDELIAGAQQAASFLKALGNANRLVTLCHVAEGERSVGELETLLGLRQPTLSQQLGRLREEQLVMTRREGKQVFSRLASPVIEVMDVLYRLFCGPTGQGQAERAAAALAAE